MSPEIVTWIWCASGVLLIAAELVFPHFFAGFLGVAALLVAALRWIGLISSLGASVAVWAICSVILLLTLRHLAMKKLRSESHFQITDEDVEAHGEIAEVVKELNTENNQGRIRYRGTTWPAISKHGVLAPGTKVRILYRDNLNWIVEPSFEEPSSGIQREKQRET
jgi:inner membrane protein